MSTRLKRINKMARDCSLMVLEVNTAFYQAFGDKKSFFIPRWIGQEADISVNTSSFNRHEKQINKHNLRFEVTNDRNQFDKFYQDMYVPYITKVFGNTAILMSYYEMEKNFKNGILLLVKRDEEYMTLLINPYNWEKDEHSSFDFRKAKMKRFSMSGINLR